MGVGETAFALEIAGVVTVTLLIVAIVAFASGACAAGRAAVHDVERALGAATIMTYAQAAAAARKSTGKPPPSFPEEECCAICLSEYAARDELVRVVPACGHFFHARCGGGDGLTVDGWLRARGTCPLCRGALLPRPEQCPPMPPRPGQQRSGLLLPSSSPQ